MEAGIEKIVMLMDVVFTNVVIVLIVIWLIVFIICLLSVSRRTDIGLPVKLFWAAIIFLAPVIGLVFYIIFGFPKNKLRGKRTEHH